jgi:hypothetical protein
MKDSFVEKFCSLILSQHSAHRQTTQGRAWFISGGFVRRMPASLTSLWAAECKVVMPAKAGIQIDFFGLDIK